MKGKEKHKKNLKKAATIGLTGIAGAAALAAGTNAYAYPIRYDNTGLLFIWDETNILDITKPANEQPGSYGFTQYFSSFNGYRYGSIFGYPSNFKIAHDGYYYARTFAEGEMIDSSADFSSYAKGYYGYNGTVYFGVGVEESEYIGLQIPGSEYYGWALLDYNDAEGRWDALAWGYETEPNTGIPAGAETAIPEPGTLAMLAMGAGALLAGKRLNRKK